MDSQGLLQESTSNEATVISLATPADLGGELGTAQRAFVAEQIILTAAVELRRRLTGLADDQRLVDEVAAWLLGVTLRLVREDAPSVKASRAQRDAEGDGCGRATDEHAGVTGE